MKDVKQRSNIIIMSFREMKLNLKRIEVGGY